MLDVDLRQLDVAGARVAYRRAGHGPSVVLLHGGLSDSREWLPLMTDLADDADLVAVDIPGCGGSDDPPDGVTLADLADVVAGVAAALQLDRPVVSGLSFGGGLALQVATRHPELPGSLVLMSGYAGWAGSLPAGEVAARREWGRAFLHAEKPSGDVDPAQVVPGVLGSPLPPDLADLLARTTADFRPEPTAALLEAFADADLSDELGAVRCPTLVLHGDQDVRAPRYVAEALQRGIPDSRLVVIPGVGHMVNLEARDDVARLLREHLRAVAEGSVG